MTWAWTDAGVQIGSFSFIYCFGLDNTVYENKLLLTYYLLFLSTAKSLKLPYVPFCQFVLFSKNIFYNVFYWGGAVKKVKQQKCELTVSLASVVSYVTLLFLSLRCPVLLHLYNWLWLSWRLGILASLCSTVKRPSWHRRERFLTLLSSTFSTFPMTKSLLSTYHSSCQCVYLFCCHC